MRIKMDKQFYSDLENVSLILLGIVLGLFIAILFITTVSAYPLQLYPNGSTAEVNLTIDSIPLNIYYYNGSLYLLPENITTNIINYNITNITNFTCYNCSYNITNITIINGTNSSYYDSKLGNISERIDFINNSYINFTAIQGSLFSNFSQHLNETVVASGWRTADIFMTIGILIAIAIGGFALYGAIKLSR
jgi:hypothetical protein